MRVLDLFSGIGGFSLGLEQEGYKTVGFCEIDKFCQKVLEKNFNASNVVGHKAAESLLKEGIEVVCGGFPCQDISTAGKGAGLAGHRSGLWREMLRTIRLVRPRYVIVENVAALLNRGMGTVLGQLAQSGYDSEWDCIPAIAVGADHIRDRVWIVANDNDGDESYCRWSSRASQEVGKSSTNTDSPRELQSERVFAHFGRWLVNGVKETFSREFWSHQPLLGRGIHGIPNRVDRVEALGNVVVPKIPQGLGWAIKQPTPTNNKE